MQIDARMRRQVQRIIEEEITIEATLDELKEAMAIISRKLFDEQGVILVPIEVPSHLHGDYDKAMRALASQHN